MAYIAAKKMEMIGEYLRLNSHEPIVYTKALDVMISADELTYEMVPGDTKWYHDWFIGCL